MRVVLPTGIFRHVTFKHWNVILFYVITLYYSIQVSLLQSGINALGPDKADRRSGT